MSNFQNSFTTWTSFLSMKNKFKAVEIICLFEEPTVTYKLSLWKMLHLMTVVANFSIEFRAHVTYHWKRHVVDKVIVASSRVTIQVSSKIWSKRTNLTNIVNDCCKAKSTSTLTLWALDHSYSKRRRVELKSVPSLMCSWPCIPRGVALFR